MNVTVSREPCLLLETMELVYSYKVQEPVDRLVGRGEFSIPPGEVLRIRNEVCRDLDLEDKTLQFYFNGVPLEEGMGKRNFCLASAIVYTPMRVTCRDVDEMAHRLSADWASMPKPRIISGINSFGLAMGHTDPDAFRPFSEEVAKLPLPAAFQVQLVDVFTNYDHYLTRLVEFLRPLARKLEPLLEPWVQRMQPLIDQWVEHMNGEEPLRFIRDRTCLNSVGCRELSVAMRYFPGADSYLRLWERDTSGCFLSGIGMEVGGKITRPAETLADWEIYALRQLANPDRIAMLQAMMNRYMSGTDLVQELGLHSGTVFRDLNNLGRAMLIDRELMDGKNVYRTNYARLRKLTQRVLEIIGPEEQ